MRPATPRRRTESGAQIWVGSLGVCRMFLDGSCSGFFLDVASAFWQLFYLCGSKRHELAAEMGFLKHHSSYLFAFFWAYQV